MKQKHSHSQYFLSLINFSQISVSSDNDLNSVYPLEYLEYSSSLYHKPIHFFTFTLELIFTFHCPKAMRPHDTALVHVTCHIPWYPLHPWQGQWWHYMSHACWHVSHMETEPTICMTCHVQAVDMTSWSWYSRVILTEAAGQWQHVTWHASWWRGCVTCDGVTADSRLAASLLGCWTLATRHVRNVWCCCTKLRKGLLFVKSSY